MEVWQRIIKDFDQLIRYFLSGAVGVLAFILLDWSSLHPWMMNAPTFSLFIVGSISLVFGALVYSVHRSCHIWIDEYFTKKIYKDIKPDLSLSKADEIPDLVLKADIIRWSKRDADASLQKYIFEWASQIHFLYCSSYALLFAYIVFGIESRSNLVQCKALLVMFLALLCYCRANRSHNRYIRWERWLFEYEKKSSHDWPRRAKSRSSSSTKP